MRSVLLNKANEHQFATDGYVVIKNILPHELLLSLQEFVSGLNMHTSENFVLANLLSDLNLRTKIHEQIGKLVAPWSTEILQDMKYTLGTLAIKPVGKKSSFGVHQDWSLVDESKFLSLSVWIPLVNTNVLNGCFRVLPKSCKYFYHERGMNIPFPYESYGAQLEEKFMMPIKMQVGDVLVFDHRLVHDSQPNLSHKTRTAVVLAFIPKETSACHYYRDKEKNAIDFYQLPEDFLVTNNFFDYSQPPKNSLLLRSYTYTDPQINFEKFKQLYASSIL